MKEEKGQIENIVAWAMTIFVLTCLVAIILWVGYYFTINIDKLLFH